MIKTELYFGRDISHFCGECRRKHKAYVSDIDWDEFKLNVLDKHLDSFTVLDAKGTWMGISEETKIIIVFWDPDDLEELPMLKMNNKFSIIMESYRKKFHQESVMMTTQAVEVRF